MSVLIPSFESTLATASEFRSDVLRGLSATSRLIPSKYFYDAAGSQLFDRICELDEYYPTRTETSIMQTHATEMAACIGPNVRLVEYGSGSSIKTRILLDHLADPISYLPVDISAEHLIKTADTLSREYPQLDVSPVVADFTEPLKLPRAKPDVARTCVYFPGSTIGNFCPDDAVRLLQTIASGSAGLLIGFDLQKSASVIEAAYNDRLGVTSEFNRNLLRRINRELDGDFDLNQFEHFAFYNAPAGRIEMRLVSQRAQTVTIAERQFHFHWGETILTEYSHKYAIEGFTELAKVAGWTSRQTWTDNRHYFAVMFLDR